MSDHTTKTEEINDCKVLVSACLIGREVRYDGTSNRVDRTPIETWRDHGLLVPFCPEVQGGLSVPRPPAEIRGGRDGNDVVAGRARVETEQGSDVTDAYLKGARRALKVARANQCGIAVLKDGSPSCGSQYVYDGSFSGSEVDGVGVTTALLKSHGIAVFSEQQLDEADQWLRSRHWDNEG